MDHRKRLSELAEFLKPYQRIWQNEIMLMYPKPLDGFNLSWLDEIASFTEKEDIIKLEKKEFRGLLKNPDLVAFYERVEELSQLPQAPEFPPMPESPFTWLHMIPKKQYEIRKLAPFINHQYHEHGVQNLVDI